MMSPAVRPFAATSLFALVLAACGGQDAPAPPAEQRSSGAAPAPSEIQEPDPSVRRIERAAPPELQALATGRFQPRGARAEAATGAIEIGDDTLTGAEGLELRTSRIAIVRGDDQFRPGERYSSALMVGAAQPVELRRVVPRGDAEATGDAEAGAGSRTEADDASTRLVDASARQAEVDAADDAAATDPDAGTAPGGADASPEPRGPGLCADGEADFVALVSVSEGDRDVVRLVGLQGRSTPASGAEDVRACDTLEYEVRRRR